MIFIHLCPHTPTLPYLDGEPNTEHLIRGQLCKPKKNHPQVGVVMGSDSDWPLMEPRSNPCSVRRAIRDAGDFRPPDPELATAYASGAPRRGLQVIIAAAGGAAHLAGVLAANTILPVIGVPVKSGTLDGLDALLSTVQMPSVFP